jgi:hypothetical protein
VGSESHALCDASRYLCETAPEVRLEAGVRRLPGEAISIPIGTGGIVEFGRHWWNQYEGVTWCHSVPETFTCQQTGIWAKSDCRWERLRKGRGKGKRERVDEDEKWSEGDGFRACWLSRLHVPPSGRYQRHV